MTKLLAPFFSEPLNERSGDDFANSSSSDDDDSVCSTESGTESKASCTVFVGSGLPSDIREKQIEEHFSVHGFEPFITKVVVPFNKAIGTTKGLGFVTFNSLKQLKEPYLLGYSIK
ncbi:hypothetical protein EMCRGX_G024840 [Ephydatia muelleri]